MSNDLILAGTWWFPEQPNRKCLGNLCYSSDDTIELALEAKGSFDMHLEKQLSFPMIFGTLKDGTEVTLADCSVMENEQAANTVRFLVSSVLQGSQLCKGETDHSEKDYAHFLQFSSFIKKF